MLKKSSLKRIFIASLSLLILLIICLFPKNNIFKEEIKYNKDNSFPIYLIDNNGYVARTNIIKNNITNNDLVKEIIDTLTINHIKSSYIPMGFKPIIPKNTKLLNTKIENNILYLDFSKELLNIEEKNENKLLESLIYSLLEINDIKGIKLLVENKLLTKFNSGNILPEKLDRNIGVNKEYNINNIKNTNMTTIYYLSKYNNNYYYIPISKINNNDNHKIEIIVKELKSTPLYETNLISFLNDNAILTNYEILENEINLSFNNSLLANIKENELLEEVKYSLALSIRDNYNINKVSMVINDEKDTILL